MENDLILHGDVEAALVKLLTDSSVVQAFTPVTVATDLIGFTAGDKWIRVVLQGGSLTYPNKVDMPRVDFNVYGPDRVVTNDLARTALAVLLKTIGPYVAYGANLCYAKVETGLFRAPDKDSDSVRYIFSLRLFVVPG